MSELNNLIKEKREKLPTRKKIGRLCKMTGDYCHIQSVLSINEKEKLLFMTGENVQDSIRTAITFYLENKVGVDETNNL